MSGAPVMSQLSKVNHSRNQWKHKAKQRGDRDRSRRKQIARISAERDRTTKALQETQARLQETQARLHQLESQLELIQAKKERFLAL